MKKMILLFSLLGTLAAAQSYIGSTIPDGTPVAITGAQGQRVTIAPADADASAVLAQVIGITTEAIR